MMSPSHEGSSSLRLGNGEIEDRLRQAALTAGNSLIIGVLSFLRVGGRDRDRTCDLMLAKHALSQLSYTPTSAVPSILIDLSGFENR